MIIAAHDDEAKGHTDPEAVLGRVDGHLRVGVALDRTGGQVFLKYLFEEFVGRGFHQLDQV